MLPEIKLFVFIAALVVFSMTATAQDKAFSCEDAFKLKSPLEETACINDISGSEVSLQKQLEQTSDIVLDGSGNQEYVVALEAAHKAWTSYRDAECQYKLISLGSNTMGGSAQIACVADMNRDRAVFLQQEAENWKD